MKNLRLLFAFMILSMSFTSCLREVFCEEGEGRKVTETLIVDNFTGIDLKEDANVTVVQGPIQEVIVTGHGNIIDRLLTDVNGGIWDINLGKDCFIDLDLTIEITIPFIEELNVSSSGKMTVGDFSDLGNMDMSVTGSGTLEFGQLAGTRDIDIEISGSGEVLAKKLLTELDKLNIEITGSGDFDGYKVVTKDLDARIAGSGNIFATVEDNVNIRITGSGDFHYKGNPLIDANITGSGKIINEN